MYTKSEFIIDLFEQITKDIVMNKEAHKLTYILLDYDKNNRGEIFNRLYFQLRMGGPDGLGWAPKDCTGLANYWLDMMDKQTFKWY